MWNKSNVINSCKEFELKYVIKLIIKILEI